MADVEGDGVCEHCPNGDAYQCGECDSRTCRDCASLCTGTACPLTAHAQGDRVEGERWYPKVFEVPVHHHTARDAEWRNAFCAVFAQAGIPDCLALRPDFGPEHVDSAVSAIVERFGQMVLDAQKEQLR